MVRGNINSKASELRMKTRAFDCQRGMWGKTSQKREMGVPRHFVRFGSLDKKDDGQVRKEPGAGGKGGA